MGESAKPIGPGVETLTFSDADSLRQVWPGAWFESLGAQGFRATVRRRRFPRMLLEGVEADPYRCQRTSLDVAAHPVDAISINVVMEGSLVMREAGAEYEATAGDVFVHRLRAFSFECPTSTRTFRAVVPPRLLPPLLGADHSLGLCPPSTLTRAYTGLADQILTSSAEDDTAAAEAVIEQSALDLQRALVESVLTRYARRPQTRAGLRAEILDHIEHHLSDPALGAEQLIRDFRISRRWLFRAFEGEPETLSSLIRRRRVERATSDLEQHPGDTVQDIGRRNGFAGRDLFTRAFREHHGHSPAEHKRAQMYRQRTGSNGDV